MQVAGAAPDDFSDDCSTPTCSTLGTQSGTSQQCAKVASGGKRIYLAVNC